VDRVLGKAGRADTPTDPAPLSMLETMSWSGQYEAMQRERLTIILPVTLACILLLLYLNTRSAAS
jgi:Cu/Ag efflux pump CusA